MNSTWFADTLVNQTGGKNANDDSVLLLKQCCVSAHVPESVSVDASDLKFVDLIENEKEDRLRGGVKVFGVSKIRKIDIPTIFGDADSFFTSGVTSGNLHIGQV